MRTTKQKVITALGAALGLTAMVAATASASVGSPGMESILSEPPDVEREGKVLIVDPSSWVPFSAESKDSSRTDVLVEGFYVTGKVDPDTLVVMPDFLEAVGLDFDEVRHITTREELQLAIEQSTGIHPRSGCGSWGFFVAPLGGGWSSTYTQDCTIIGSPGWKTSYQWELSPGTNQHACAQGVGYFYQRVSPNSFGYVKLWYGLGCGTSNGGEVPWGNVAAKKQFRAKSTIVVHLATGQWR